MVAVTEIVYDDWKDYDGDDVDEWKLSSNPYYYWVEWGMQIVIWIGILT